MRATVLFALPLLLVACGAPAPAKTNPAAEVVPWTATPASLEPIEDSLPVPDGTRRCAASDLTVNFGNPDALTGGSLTASLITTNHSNTPCVVAGRPGLAALGPDGRRLGVPVTKLDIPAPERVLLLPGVTQPSPHSPPVAGQAWLTLAWPTYRDRPPCTPSAPQVTGLLVDLGPGDGAVKVPVSPSMNPCGHIAVSRFQAPVLSKSSAMAPSLRVELETPSSVRAGASLDYRVKITNVGATTLSFETICPSYSQLLVRPPDLKAGGSYRLNCKPAPTLGPDRSATFAMVLAIPTSATAGSATLSWSLLGDAMRSDDARATVTVTSS
jgi:hypothetical protein